MPVTVEYKLKEGGWKKEENNRFGSVAVAVFKDFVTGARLFEWAPTLKDCEDMAYFCALVKALDEHNKAILLINREVEGLNPKVAQNESKAPLTCPEVVPGGCSL